MNLSLLCLRKSENKILLELLASKKNSGRRLKMVPFSSKICTVGDSTATFLLFRNSSLKH